VARSKKVARTERAGVDADALLAANARWLKRQPLAPRSRDAYLTQVRDASRIPAAGTECNDFVIPKRASHCRAEGRECIHAGSRASSHPGQA